MSYLFDLYRGEELDASFVEFALYMAFFPVTISGPICRMPDMLPQFRSEKLTRKNEFGRSLVRMATGILMIQLARLLGQGILSGDGIVRGFDQATMWSGADAWCLAFGYGLQLFFDFAGYSHIAIGAAQALGFTVPENFNRPFTSTTLSIFWTRWHMSLSFWIRDYLFFPLATMRREIWWRNFVLALSMVVFGVWHQGTVLFMLWGIYHGILLVLHRQIQQVQKTLNWAPPNGLWTALSWLVTICLVSLGWVFFRANSVTQAKEMLLAVFSGSYSSHFLSGSLYALVSTLAAGYAAVLLAEHWMNRATAPQETASAESRPEFIAKLARSRWYWIPPLYVVVLIIVLLVTHSRESGAAQFMYRRF
jgi:alginate O-acetyltransferase complex protein AlgI